MTYFHRRKKLNKKARKKGTPEKLRRARKSACRITGTPGKKNGTLYSLVIRRMGDGNISGLTCDSEEYSPSPESSHSKGSKRCSKKRFLFFRCARKAKPVPQTCSIPCSLDARYVSAARAMAPHHDLPVIQMRNSEASSRHLGVIFEASPRHL